MDVLWAAEECPVADGARGARGPQRADRDLAYTTVMTVLDRLARKELVGQQREGRAFRYRARASRAELTAELMHEALDDFTAHDRGQALVAFVGEASADDIAGPAPGPGPLDG